MAKYLIALVAVIGLGAAAYYYAGTELPEGIAQNKETMTETAPAPAEVVEVTVEEPLPMGGPEVLNIYNWSDYIAEDTVANFEERSSIEVTYDVFDSNEVLEGKLLAGSTGYDIVVPSGSFLENQIKAGVFQPINKSKLANYGNLDPGIMAKLEIHDPGNTYAVPYMWGTTGIGYNVGMVEERLGADAPTDSWDLIFKEEYASKLADCGITLLDAPSEVLEIAQNYLGLDPHAGDQESVDKAQELLMKARPHIKYFHSSSYIDDLANGEICVALGWSGDVFIAADEAADDVEVAYSIPKEGTVIWFDLMAIPTDAPNPGAAHQFIDYILEPEVVAGITNAVWYANPTPSSLEFVEAEIKEDPAIYPPEDVLANLFADQAQPQDVSRRRTRAWTNIKAGQ